MPHPLQNIWDQQKQVDQFISNIYGAQPVKGVLKDGVFTMDVTISNEVQQQLDNLRAIRDYLNRIENKFYQRPI